MDKYIEKEIAIENCNLKEVWFSNRYSMIHDILRFNREIYSVIIPDPVKRICNHAFSFCEELTSVSLPDSLCSIGNGAFCRCSKLKSITIPCNVKEIGGNVFRGCRELSSVTILSRIIPDFSYCKKISSIYIGENLEEFDKASFDGCKNIKSIVVDKNNKFYDSRNNCNGIIETKSNTLIFACNTTKIPEGVKHIDSRAFWDCGRIKTLSLPSSLESIERLPENVNKIIVPKGRKREFERMLPWNHEFTFVEQ